VSRSSKVALTVVMLALSIAPAVALGGSTQATSNSTVFQDSVGEDAQAPDITSTTVSNDDAGLITFHVAISNRPALTQDMLVAIVLDSDHNPATGDTQGLLPGFPGTDYLIELDPGQVNLFKWNGSDYLSTAAPSLVYSYDATGATIKLRAADAGNPKTLDFAVIAISGIGVDAQGNPDLTNAHRDSSPDPGHGAFTYQVNVKVTLSVTAFTTTPKPVRAGKPFSVGLAADESDTSGPVGQGRVTCVATIAGKRLKLRGSRLVNGVAVCVWAVPKTAKGKRIKGSISLAAQGAQVSRAFSLKIA
jgi:hypothetical protein